jgi:hypothetical protein
LLCGKHSGGRDPKTQYHQTKQISSKEQQEMTRSEAEEAGWVFVHESEATTETTSATQGEQCITAASCRAEKALVRPGRLTQLVNEQAETEELLLERIELFEAVH